jgi:hypothetical protein
MSNWKKRLSWLPPEDPENPYPYEVLDCRAVCATLAFATRNEMASEAVATIEKIVKLSPSARMVGDSLSVSCAIRIHGCYNHSDRSTFVAPTIGHKWLIETAEATILAKRRWTGQLVHLAEFEALDKCLIIKRLTSQSQSVYGSSDYAIAEIEFLLKTYLEGAACAFPIPPGLTRHDRSKIAVSGWRVHGSIAQFGRFV